MVDQLFPELRDKTELNDRATEFVSQLEESLQCNIDLVGTGPETMVAL